MERSSFESKHGRPGSAAERWCLGCSSLNKTVRLSVLEVLANGRDERGRDNGIAEAFLVAVAGRRMSIAALRSGRAMSVAEKIRRRCTVMAMASELVVERDGRVVAVLSEPLLEDMFWFSWKITPLVGDAPVTSDAFWRDSQDSKTVFRCNASGAVAGMAFPAASNPVREGRLVLRGAYVPFALSFRRRPFTWLRLFLFGGGAYDYDEDEEERRTVA